MKSSRTLNKMFEEAHDDLAILVTRTRLLKRMTQQFRALLDTELAPHCHVAAIQADCLHVYVDSAAWATRLRFQVPQLLGSLGQANTAFSKLRQIKVSTLVQHEAPTQANHNPPGPVMSEDNASIINSLSDSVTDPDLRQALQRLARHGQSK